MILDYQVFLIPTRQQRRYSQKNAWSQTSEVFKTSEVFCEIKACY